LLMESDSRRKCWKCRVKLRRGGTVACWRQSNFCGRRSDATMQTPHEDDGDFLRMPYQKSGRHRMSRRKFLQGMSMAPLLYRASSLWGPLLPPLGNPGKLPRTAAFPFADVRLTPHYPSRSPLEDVLRRVAPGNDEFVTEKYALELEGVFRRWTEVLVASERNL